MGLRFEGTAHPPAPARGRGNDIGDLSSAEIATTSMGRGAGTDLLVEHDPAARVGRVHASWQSPLDGSLRVLGVVDDAHTAAAVERGELRGLSLGTEVLTRSDGRALDGSARQKELSLVSQPARTGCWVDTINGKRVLEHRRYSARAAFTAPASEAAATVASDAAFAGVSAETHSHVKEELERTRQQLAAYKARTEVIDTQKREELSNMKSDVSSFISDIVNDDTFAPYKHEMAPMCRWAAEMEAGDAIDTNLSIGRTLACASARYKRKADETKENVERAELLAETMKKLEASEADRSHKEQCLREMKDLAEERGRALELANQQLEKNGLLLEKKDFSQRAARENVPSANESMASSATSNTAPTHASARAPRMDDALLSFISAGASGNGRMKPTGNSHHWLGAAESTHNAGSSSMSPDIAAALGMHI